MKGRLLPRNPNNKEFFFVQIQYLIEIHQNSRELHDYQKNI